MKKYIIALLLVLSSVFSYPSYASPINFNNMDELERWTKDNPRPALEYTKTVIKASPDTTEVWYTGAPENDYQNGQDKGLSNPLQFIQSILDLDEEDYTISASSVSKRESTKLIALFDIYNEKDNALQVLTILMPNTFL